MRGFYFFDTLCLMQKETIKPIEEVLETDILKITGLNSLSEVQEILEKGNDFPNVSRADFERYILNNPNAIKLFSDENSLNFVDGHIKNKEWPFGISEEEMRNTVHKMNNKN